MTSTGWLSPTGEVPHVQMLYGGKGSVAGQGRDRARHPMSFRPAADTLSSLRKDFGVGSKERSYKRGFGATLTGGRWRLPGADARHHPCRA